MAVKIGHASIDERGRINGGTAGDQTSREVCTREWYAKSWTVMLRPKTLALAEKSAKACEKLCADNKIGYDQYQRNTAHTQLQKYDYDVDKYIKKGEKAETDCSAFMTLCAIIGGDSKLEYSGNAPATSTMRKAFVDSGMYTAYTDSKYLTSDSYLKRGDILVAEGHHTVMVLSNGSKASNVSASTSKSSSTSTIKKYTQKSFITDVKEILGVNTAAKAFEKTVTLSTDCNDNHKLVTPLERYLKALGYYTGSIEADAGKTPQFGSGLESAVKKYQKNVVKQSNPDGVITAKNATWKKLLDL